MRNLNRWYSVTVATSEPNRVRYIFRRTHSFFPAPLCTHAAGDWLAERELNSRATWGADHTSRLKRAIKRRLGVRALSPRSNRERKSA